MEFLDLNRNQITQLKAGFFNGLSNLKYILLSDNLLRTPNRTFRNLNNVVVLDLTGNGITNLNGGEFVGLSKLRELLLSDNLLSTFPNNIFQDLISLELLLVIRNQMTYLNEGAFGIGLQKLKILVLRQNKLNTLDTDLFHNLASLERLMLSYNLITTLPNGIFMGLKYLEHIDISHNKLTQLGVNVFKGLSNLNELFLQNNTLTQLDYDVVKDTINLDVFNLSTNRLNAIPNIENLTQLTILDITENLLLWVSGASFSSLSWETNIIVSQHEICECYVPSYVNCGVADKRSPYLTCDRLLSDRALVVIMWLIGLGALSGNLFVLVWRKKEANISTVNSMFLQNLAASDLLMGIYMLIIACADIYFGENFPMQSESWRSGITCRIAGALSIISSEASVLFVVLISIDRFIAIKFPYSTRKFRKQSAKVVATITWIISLVLGTVPSVLSGYSFKFYDNSHVCIGLPLALTKFYVREKTTIVRYFQVGPETTSNVYDFFIIQFMGLENGLFFSTAVFLGLNGVCYLIILGCYIEIIRAVRKSIKESGRSQEMQQQIRLTAKVTAIVATDFFCWFPVILLGILVQTKVIEPRITLPRHYLPVSICQCTVFLHNSHRK